MKQKKTKSDKSYKEFMKKYGNTIESVEAMALEATRERNVPALLWLSGTAWTILNTTLAILQEELTDDIPVEIKGADGSPSV